MKTLFLAAAPLLLAACASQQTLPQPTHVYGCTGDISLIKAAYPDAHTAVLTLQTGENNPTHVLKQEEAASGVRYAKHSRNSATPGTLIWWTKGDTAMLYVTAQSEQDPTVAAPSYLYEKQLASCALSYQTEALAPQK